MYINKGTVRTLSNEAATLSNGRNVSVRMITNGAQNDWDGPGYCFNTALADSIKGRNSTRYAAFFMFGAINGWHRHTEDRLPGSVVMWNPVLGSPNTAQEWHHLYRGWGLADTLYRHTYGQSGDNRPDVLTMAEYHLRALPLEPGVRVKFLTAHGKEPQTSQALPDTGVSYEGRVLSAAYGCLAVRPTGHRKSVDVHVSQVTRVY